MNVIVCCMHIDVSGDMVLHKSPRFLTILRSARQLWQPVMAMVLTKVCACSALRGNPNGCSPFNGK